jgi:hypothetical protein
MCHASWDGDRERRRGEGEEASRIPCHTLATEPYHTPKSNSTVTCILAIVTPLNYLNKYCKLDHRKRDTHISNSKDLEC